MRRRHGHRQLEQMFLPLSILERIFRRPSRARGSRSMPTAADRRARLFPLPMVALFAALLTSPLWLAKVGLYQYLALEIMIWMLFALGSNLLLGYGGLPSFGHGAFFGIGAYAFGLLQLRVWPNLWFDLVGAAGIAAVLGGVVAAFISHRRGIYYALLTI